jgi:hypothetical protein
MSVITYLAAIAGLQGHSVTSDVTRVKVGGADLQAEDRGRDVISYHQIGHDTVKQAVFPFSPY